MISFFRSSEVAGFERRIMPHLDEAYSLARFLMRNEIDAEDVVQEASLRAFRFYDGFRGDNARAWFLSIVRNTAFTALKRTRKAEADVVFDEELHTPESSAALPGAEIDREVDRKTVRAAIEQLPAEFREVITLRELERCAYKEIADIINAPIGTVMSRLARARRQLHAILAPNYPAQSNP